MPKSKPPKRLRVIVLMHESLIPPNTIDGLSDEEVAPFKTEFDVVVTLKEMGHEVLPLGISDDLSPIRTAIDHFKPDVVFNLLEEFDGVGVFDAHVVSFLEMMRQPYTGCNPRGLILAHDKALSKMVCKYHRIRVPEFAVFRKNQKVHRPKKLALPLLVKSLTEEGSVGISQASVVYDDDKLVERVHFIHEHVGTAAIAEQYIEGRELYVGVMGNQRLETLPIWELRFTKLREDAPRIATGKVKWDYKYQEKVGVETGVAVDLPQGLDKSIPRLVKRAYRCLSLSGYARLDLRVTDAGEVYLIEANPNPQIAFGEDFAESAEAGGMPYEALMARVMQLGMQYDATALA
jgi:D-alanine-D-alanine ligase